MEPKNVPDRSPRARYARDGLQRLQAIAQRKGGTCLATRFTGRLGCYPFQCAKGHTWNALGSNVFRGSWCGDCVNDAKRHRLETMQSLANTRGGRCLSDTYVTHRIKLTWQCHRGHVWEAISGNVLRGHWCPECKFLTLSRLFKMRHRRVMGKRPACPPVQGGMG
jgi:hypothetical protein